MKHYLIIIFVVWLFGCKKETFITSPDASIRTSVDSIRFDTLFTTFGSTTRFVKIHNVNNQHLRISNIELAGGNGSFFRINADGLPGPVINDIEIAPQDSAYIFVTVTIDPNANPLPFILRDSISIEYNGNVKWVQLEAWGQNARFFRSRTITINETWNNALPYVLIGPLIVAANATLTIEEGTKVYLHADAPLVIDGSLVVNGKVYDSTRVVFTGDRLDDPYRDFPGSWPGIYFRQTSKDNILTYAVIRNAYQGIVTEKPSINANPKVRLNDCVVDNCYDAGLISAASSITATNCLFSNNGKNMMLVQGGDYDFTHCTSAAYSTSFIIHKDPVLLITDYIKNGDVILSGNLTAHFSNCIFWGETGSVENEIVTGKQGTGTFDITLTNCLWKAKTDVPDITKVNSIINQDPLFDSVDVQNKVFNFRLKTGSPAIDKGVITSITTDLDGKLRTGLPDIGSYEKN